VQAQELLRQGHLNDPDEHFPYRHSEVAELVEANPPMGPNGEDDDSFRVEDYMSQEIADASRDYIDAQQDYLRDPGDATRAEYDRTRDALLAARRAHRARRRGVYVGGVMRAPRAGE
jgi:hypothetical protein